jgi:hypothetical protein
MDGRASTPKPTATETEMLPPPYTPPPSGFYDDEEEEEFAPTTNITIHAPISIHGSHNVISGPMMDPTRLAGLLISSLNQKYTVTSSRQSNITIQINCGMNVVGERNIVGNVGLRPRTVLSGATLSMQGTPAVPEAIAASTILHGKRKASEVCCYVHS